MSSEFNMELINSLQNFSLDEKVIEMALKMKIEPKKMVTNKQEQPKFFKPKHKIYIPREKDTLFWCFYIMKNSDIQYEMLENKNIILEKKNKIEYVEKIRKDKQTIKTYKFSTLTKLENNLVNEDKINIGTFLSLCAFENINVLFIKNKTYYELLMNDSKEIFIIYQVENGKFGIEPSTIDTIDNIKITLFQIDNVEKPIKAISSYKVQDLIDTCHKLGIESTNKTTNKTKNKKELYEDIVNYF